MTGEATVHSGLAVGKATLSETVSVLARILVPLVFIVVGFFASVGLGGGYSIGTIIWNSGGGQATWGSSGNQNRIGAGIVALIWGLIGVAFWSLRSRGGWIFGLIGGALGGFFFGAALGQVPEILSGQAIPSGWLDKMFSGTSAAIGATSSGA